MIIEFFYALLVLYVTTIIGIKVFRLFKLNLDIKEELIFSVALGLGIVGNFILILGLSGLLYKSLFLIMFGLLAIAFIPEAKLFLFKLGKPKIKLNWVGVLIILFLLFNLVGALAPPIGWDTQKYHLSCQEEYLSQNKIVYVPILHCDLPSLANMFILLGMIFQNDIVSKLIFYFVFLTLVFAVYTFSNKYFGEKCALLSALIFVSLPNIIYYASTVHTDMFLSLFTLTSLFAFFYWEKEKKKNLAVLAAVLIGFVFATKITGIIQVMSFVILFLLIFLFSRDRKKVFLQGLIFAIIISIISGIWFLKAFIFTGNPVYPIAYNIFGGIQNLSYNTEYTSMQLSMGGFGKGIIQFILSPFHINMNGYKFLSSFSLGALFLSFIPILFFVKKEKMLKNIFLFLFIYYSIWFFMHPFLMKLISILPILSIITSYSILRGFDKKILWKFMWVFIIGAFLFSLIMSGLIYKEQYKVAFGIESRENYLSKNIDSFEVFNYANLNLSDENKILLIGEERNYYLDTNFQEGDPIRQGLIDYRNINNSEFKNWLDKENITHIIINGNYFENISDSKLNLYGYTEYSYGLIDNFTKEDTELVYEKNNVFLYKID